MYILCSFYIDIAGQLTNHFLGVVTSNRSITRISMTPTSWRPLG